MQPISLPYAVIEKREGILWLILHEDAELDVKEVNEFTKICQEMAGQRPYVLVSDARVNVTITSEGRKAAADKEVTPMLVANAVLVNNTAVRITANFFSKFNKPHFKYRIFNSEAKATAWLRKQIKE